MLGPHTITRLRATTTRNAYGNDETDWSAPDRLPITGCNVQPQQTQEYANAREGIEERSIVWADLDADITGRDRVEWDGQVYELLGHPQRWAFGQLGHITFTLRRFDG